MPKLYLHFQENNITPHLYATEWFMTIFSLSMPFEVTLRIWDIYLVEGVKIIYRVALAIIKLNYNKLISSDFTGVLQTL